MVFLRGKRNWLRKRRGVSFAVIGSILFACSIAYVSASAATDDNQSALSSLPNTLDDQDSQHFNSTLPEYVVIQPSEEVTYSSETSASVGEISVKEGSTFSKGAALLKLDCRIQEADLKKAQAEKSVSDLGFISAQKLKKYKAISDLEYQQAQSQKSVSDAEVEKLKAVVEKCTLVAPFNGSVARLMVHMFETVKPGDPLLKIVSIEDLDFVLQVPSNWLEWLHIGSTVHVQVNEINKNVEVKVVKISPEIDSVSQTVKVFAKSVTPDSALMPGMSGQATFPDKPLPKPKPLPTDTKKRVKPIK